jgi:hypothetical protein
MTRGEQSHCSPSMQRTMHELRFLRSENIRDIIQNTRKLNKQGMKILNNRQIIKCEIFHQRLHKKVTSSLKFHFSLSFPIKQNTQIPLVKFCQLFI